MSINRKSAINRRIIQPREYARDFPNRNRQLENGENLNELSIIDQIGRRAARATVLIGSTEQARDTLLDNVFENPELSFAKLALLKSNRNFKIAHFVDQDLEVTPYHSVFSLSDEGLWIPEINHLPVEATRGSDGSFNIAEYPRGYFSDHTGEPAPAELNYRVAIPQDIKQLVYS